MSSNTISPENHCLTVEPRQLKKISKKPELKIVNSFPKKKEFLKLFFSEKVRLFDRRSCQNNDREIHFDESEIRGHLRRAPDLQRIRRPDPRNNVARILHCRQVKFESKKMGGGEIWEIWEILAFKENIRLREALCPYM